MTAGCDFDPADVLDRIANATEILLDTAAGFSDAEVREPSLLPGWSRGHVLTHLARNADGGRHLLFWARTGAETPEYPSMAARAAQIEAGAGRSAAVLLTDVRDAAARFAAEYSRMPAGAWDHVVRWTTGQALPAVRAADSRLCEVLVHHVDLGAAYTPSQWPRDFVEDMLGRVARSFGARHDAPTMRLHATDSDAWYDVGAVGPRTQTIHGPRHSLLAWLMGRTQGTDLTTSGASALPRPPFLY
jgi:maleylpyruvate isomerase